MRLYRLSGEMNDESEGLFGFWGGGMGIGGDVGTLADG